MVHMSCTEWNECEWCADLPLDSPVDNKADCYCVSAGTNKHEHTSGFAIESVFNFFKVRRTPSNKRWRFASWLSVDTRYSRRDSKWPPSCRRPKGLDVVFPSRCSGNTSFNATRIAPIAGIRHRRAFFLYVRSSAPVGHYALFLFLSCVAHGHPAAGFSSEPKREGLVAVLDLPESAQRLQQVSTAIRSFSQASAQRLDVEASSIHRVLPCERCLRLGKESTCAVAPPKKRGRPRKEPPWDSKTPETTHNEPAPSNEDLNQAASAPEPDQDVKQDTLEWVRSFAAFFNMK